MPAILVKCLETAVEENVRFCSKKILAVKPHCALDVDFTQLLTLRRRNLAPSYLFKSKPVMFVTIAGAWEGNIDIIDREIERFDELDPIRRIENEVTCPNVLSALAPHVAKEVVSEALFERDLLHLNQKSEHGRMHNTSLRCNNTQVSKSGMIVGLEDESVVGQLLFEMSIYSRQLQLVMLWSSICSYPCSDKISNIWSPIKCISLSLKPKANPGRKGCHYPYSSYQLRCVKHLKSIGERVQNE